MPFSTKREQCSLEKWLIPGLGQGKYKMSLEHLMVLKVRKYSTIKACQMGIGENLKERPMAKLEQFELENKL